MMCPQPYALERVGVAGHFSQQHPVRLTLTYRVAPLVETDNPAIWQRVLCEESRRRCLLHANRRAAARDPGGKRGACYGHGQADDSSYAPHRRPSLAEAQLSCLGNRVKLRARAQFAKD